MTLREWPDGIVVYDDADSQLQCLNLVSGALLQLMFQRPYWTSSELARELVGEEPDPDEIEMVENALVEFSSLNLIERAQD